MKQGGLTDCRKTCLVSQRIAHVNLYSRLLDAVVTFKKGYSTTSILDVVDECSLCFAASQGFS